jgi:hypothetical protein
VVLKRVKALNVSGLKSADEMYLGDLGCNPVALSDTEALSWRSTFSGSLVRLFSGYV